MSASVFMELVCKRERREWGISASAPGLETRLNRGSCYISYATIPDAVRCIDTGSPRRALSPFSFGLLHTGSSRGYVGYVTLYDFRDINSNKGAFKREIDEQPCGREMLCDRVTGFVLRRLSAPLHRWMAQSTTTTATTKTTAILV